MGDVVEGENITYSDLNDTKISVDALNVLYQFLSIIRQRDGTPLKDSDGNVTSHLSGIFYRTTMLVENNIDPVYVFDGEMPDLKSTEAAERRKKRQEAEKEWEELKEEGKIDEAFSKAMQSSKVTGNMVDETRELLEAMGIQYVDAPSEGEAQAAHMTRKGSVDAVGSQDWDCLLFGASEMIKNLTSRKKRKTGKGSSREISTQRIALDDVTSSLGISRKKLVWMGILIGTDFNPKGVKGLGPKRSLKTVKKHESFEDVMNDSKVEWTHDNSAYKIRDFFMNPPTKEADLGSGELDRSKVKEILVDRHEFSEDRVSSNLDDLENGLNSRQPGLGSFT